jgi:hypothetical protein
MEFHKREIHGSVYVSNQIFLVVLLDAFDSDQIGQAEPMARIVPKRKEKHIDEPQRRFASHELFQRVARST